MSKERAKAFKRLESGNRGLQTQITKIKITQPKANVMQKVNELKGKQLANDESNTTISDAETYIEVDKGLKKIKAMSQHTRQDGQ